MFKFLTKYRLVIAFSVLTILLIPFSIGQPAETDKVAVVTSVGIDKVGSDVELSVNVVVPNSGQSGGSGGSDGTVKTVTAIGNNVSSAFANITLVIGKTPGLAHCDSIILNKNLFETNVLEYLDFFIRTNNLTSNATLIVAENTAKEIVETSASQKGLRAVSLSEILLLNNDYALTKNANIDAFYVEHFSPSTCSTLPILTAGDSNEESGEVGGDFKANSNTKLNSDEATSLKNNKSSSKLESVTSGTSADSSQNDSGSGSGSSSDSSNSSDSTDSNSDNQASSNGSAKQGESGNGSPPKIIKNEGKGVVVKNGKIVQIISGEEMNGVNLISKNTKRGHIEIDGVTDSYFNNADLTFEIFSKKTSINGGFVNGLPVFNYNIDLVLKLEEVSMNNFNIESLKTTKNYVEGTIKTKINQTVQHYISTVINTAKQNKCDILGVYDYFYKMHNSEWLNFIKALPEKEDYLNYVTFTCNVKSQGKI